jgi:hypothetical protein
MSETATHYALSCSVEVLYTLANVLDVFRESLDMRDRRKKGRDDQSLSWAGVVVRE